MVKLGFGPGQIGTLVSMATDSSIDLQMGKHIKKISETTRPRALIAFYSTPSNDAPGVHPIIISRTRII